MTNFAGYVDRDIVKGHAYRLAGCPVPTVFTGNIDVISDDIFVKAMLVVNDGTHGTFPKDAADTYLVNTVEYGNSTYLQSAVNCSDRTEYRRIKSGSNDWSQWLSASDVADQFDSRIKTLEDNRTVDESDIERLKTVIDGTASTAGLTSRVTILENGNYGSKITDLTNKINNKIKQVTISQNITMGTSGEVNGKFQLATELAYPDGGILIGMRVNTAQIAAINGTVYMLCYAANGTKPYINYQKGSGVTFSQIPHDFIFTFYIP